MRKSIRSVVPLLLAIAFIWVPVAAQAQLVLDSGSMFSSSGTGAGTGRGLGFQATSDFSLTAVGIDAGLTDELHRVTLYSSTDGNQTTGVLATSTATIGGLGDQFYDIALNYNLQSGEYYVISWAPDDQQTGWVQGNIMYLQDSNLPFDVGPIKMINGTERFDAQNFGNSLHPLLRFNGEPTIRPDDQPVPALSLSAMLLLVTLLSGFGWAVIRRT